MEIQEELARQIMPKNFFEQHKKNLELFDFEVQVPCSKENADCIYLEIKTYRNRPFNIRFDTLNEAESSLKELDSYLMK